MSRVTCIARQALAALLVLLLAAPVPAHDLYRAAPGTWLDDAGQSYRLESLYGAPAVFTMAYGACRRICSSSLHMLEQLQAMADARGVSLQFVVVGLDPHSDRPSDWAAFRAEHRLNRPNWHFLSGSELQTRRLATQLGVRYWRYGDHTLHDLRIVLLSERAEPLRSVQAFDADLETLLP
jgi:protein SCO1/2